MFDFVKEVNTLAKPLLEEFLQSHGVVFWPSSANYLFCYIEDPLEVEASLRARNILVRPKKDPDGVLGLRISIGNVEQTHRLIGALKEVLPQARCVQQAPKKPKV